jgi:hypothetical protein
MGTWYELEERSNRVSEKNPQWTLKYIVTGVADDSEIDADVRDSGNTPNSYLGLVRLDYEHESKGGGVYYVSVNYGIPTAENPALGDTPVEDQTIDSPTPQPPFDGQGDDGTPPNLDSGPSQTGTDSQAIGGEYSFDMSGGTVHITQSLSTLGSYGIGGAAVPDFKKAIGVSKSGGEVSVAGVDIGSGSLRLSYTGRFRFLTRKYLRTLRDTHYTTNNATYFGFDAGEVLFTGCTGTYEDGGQAPWKITFNFEVSPNLTDIAIVGTAEPGDAATSLVVTSKGGHAYLWVAYSDQIDAGEIVPRAKAAYVEQVYESKDFRPLGI